MPNFNRILDELRSNRDRAQEELQKLDEAIRGIERLAGGTSGFPTNVRRAARKTYRMSATARAKIAAAQRARWAKARRAKVSKPVRKMSRAARNKIAAAQRARWAKARAQKQTQKSSA